ncbi:hypothetical protein VOLCADRAFT_99482 [Volvox carteri f. nagariensis]|uniref:Uncharacterized protein n=1 Tax=Volvox carteri f. nagariensis TaxID=3068 RepID=D8UHX0_VOLCA|nr:uncharacterized protein VOLCADRAFT_99482 [Volvox carteri f. nagariensis]EFJ40693.1 hypothetical protein VOLCADRAFT_99482 [Volvox carteri f. nagariensis]|eukprot:XP_002958239.1 hypothetical protein VOLCADRAFT_99482 [Volvox carteri f. nagariensis]
MPADMDPSSVHLAVEMLERLYDVPLVAPRVCLRAARLRRHLGAATADRGGSQQLQAAGGLNTAALEPVPHPLQQQQQQQEEEEEEKLQQYQQPRQGVSGPDTQVMWDGSSREEDALDVEAEDNEAGGGPSRREVEGEGEGEGEGEISSPSSSSSSSSSPGRIVTTDPRDFPSLPPHRLATLLLDCASNKVPLRVSVVQHNERPSQPAADAAAVVPAPGALGTRPAIRRINRTSSSTSSSITEPGEGSADGTLRIASLDPARLVQLVDLLVKLDVRPPAGWLDSFLECSSRVVSRLHGTDLVRLLDLLVALATAPAAAWWDAVLDTWPPAGRSRLPTALSKGGDAVQQPSSIEVRCAIMYGILRLGSLRPAGALLPARLRSWALATMYDIARAVLVSGQLAAAVTALDGGADGVSAAGTVRLSASAVSPDAPSPPPPPPHAIAQALASLPAVLPQSSRWASTPSEGGCGVLAVLVAALEPQLQQLGPELLVELLRGLAASRLHPGPRFLLLHAMVLKGRAAQRELSPLQLLTAAKCYTKLGLAVRGSDRVSVAGGDRV